MNFGSLYVLIVAFFSTVLTVFSLILLRRVSNSIVSLCVGVTLVLISFFLIPRLSGLYETAIIGMYAGSISQSISSLVQTLSKKIVD